MKNITQTTLLCVFLLSGCSSKEGAMDLFRPNWTGIDTTELKFKFGQVVNFDVDSQQISAVVLDFDKDEGGIWYGLCFLDEGKLFGTQIPSGLVNTICIDLLDLTYLNDSTVHEFEIQDNLQVDISKVGVGRISPVTNYVDLAYDFNRGIEARKKDPIPCDEGMLDSNAHRQRYFELEKILKD
jgi:hypothetical protein